MLKSINSRPVFWNELYSLAHSAVPNIANVTVRVMTSNWAKYKILLFRLDDDKILCICVLNYQRKKT